MLEHFPGVTQSLGKLAGKIEKAEMAKLIEEGIKQGLDPRTVMVSESDQLQLERMVRRFLRKKGLLQR